MKITWILALTALALSACATTSKYEAVLDSWVGSTENELVASWGPPVGLYTTPDGSRVLTYNSEGNMYLPGTAPSYQSTVIGNTVYTNPVGGVAPTNIRLSCTTNFTVTNGRITMVCLPQSGPVFELVPAPIVELRHGQESKA